MAFPGDLLNLDYLVYSSHKTATQTIVCTLNENGFNCRHGHFLPNLGLKPGDFLPFLEHYLERNKKKLNVISVFREPIERHISSFFQGYGTRPLTMNLVENENETIISKYSTQQLQELFIEELNSKSLIAFRESIHSICEELGNNVDMLTYDEQEQSGIYETELIRLHLFRFDVFIKNMDTLLSAMTGKELVRVNNNMSDLKWYKIIYAKFKSTLIIPQNTIVEVYDCKRDLINLMYSDQYDQVLDHALKKYT